MASNQRILDLSSAHSKSKRLLSTYGTAIFASVFALLLTIVISGVGDRPFLMVFLGAVVVSSWYGGLASGLLSVLLGTAFSVIYSPTSPLFRGTSNVLALVMFLLIGVVLSYVISHQKRAQQLQAALYGIADKTSSVSDMQEFYRAIHKIISGLMYANNLYIALYDQKRDLLTFPYSVDERQRERPPRRPGQGLTEYVLRTGQPLLKTPKVMETLVNSGAVVPSGARAVDWLGVPLISNAGDAFGVLAVQSYTTKVRFTDQDEKILRFVSQQIASALEHKRKEAEIKDSEARYRSLVEKAVYGLFRCTGDGTFLDVNPALVAMLRCDSAADAFKLNLFKDVLLYPDQQSLFLIEDPQTGKLKTSECRWQRKDRSVMTVRLSGTLTHNENAQHAFEVLAEDITERRLLEEQLKQAQKMEAVGRLAGGVAHDFNNLLMIISGYSELLLDNLASKEQLLKTVKEVRQACDRATALVRQLLAFSRKQVLEPRIVDLNTVIEDMHRMLPRLIGEDIEVLTIPGKNLGKVKVDPWQIEQVLLNLAVNSKDAMPNGGKIIIETQNIELRDSYVRQHIGSRPGHYVMLAVSDTGFGMNQETKSHIFEPFFTTKEIGKGTGLGLSTVYGVVKQSGGYIGVYSEPGEGTSFKIYLPRVDQIEEVMSSPEADLPLEGTETVLLVEDELGVRAVAKEFLVKKGYTVLESGTGKEAIALAQTHKGPIHLLITDVIMPGMSGPELAEEIQKSRPRVKVLYMSGYTADSIVHHGISAGETAFIQKPFDPTSLLRKVRETMNTSQLSGTLH